MKVASLILFVLLALPAWSQDIMTVLKQKKFGEGEVTLRQDARLGALLCPASETETHLEGNKRIAKTPGFRVQVYAGNNSRQARNEANRMGGKVKELFADLPVYTHFVNPRWLCQVGDFRSIEEADVVMRKLKETGEFKEVAIVRGLINIAY